MALRVAETPFLVLFYFLDYDDISNQIDFIICLGGDGTLLYASSLFQVRLAAGSVLLASALHEEILSQ